MTLDTLAKALREERWNDGVIALQQQLRGLKAVLLYGSRARGCQHFDSDYDLLVLAEESSSELRRDYEGLDLDIEVVDHKLFGEPLESRLYLVPGRLIWCQEDRFVEWLAQLEQFRQAGPASWDIPQRRRQAAWLSRMWRRSQPKGCQAALRQAQLASSLPELAVQFLGGWPGGFQQDLDFLARHWPELGSLLQEWSELESRQDQLEVLGRACALCRERLLA